jgi:PAS domain S-box-containing protein
MLYYADADGRYRYVNPAYCRWVGKTSAALVGAEVIAVEAGGTDSAGAAEVQRGVSAALAGADQQFRLARRQNGRGRRMAEAHYVPDRNENGEVAGFSAMLFDVTGHAEALDQSHRERERFVHIASHDLQEPLRMVASYCNLVDRRYGQALDEDGREFLAFAVDGATRMQALIDDLLAYSRITTRGREPLAVESGAGLRAAITQLRAEIDAAEAEVAHDPMPVVMADEIQLVQLFRNLLSNALKFRSPDRTPRIRVSAVPEEREWRFTVADNGIGFDAKFADAVFDIYRRLHTHDAYPGTGMGLAICKSIVDRHAGKIWADPRPGEGVAIHFTLSSPAEGTPC